MHATTSVDFKGMMLNEKKASLYRSHTVGSHSRFCYHKVRLAVTKGLGLVRLGVRWVVVTGKGYQEGTFLC